MDELPDYTFHANKGETGLWFITCDQVRGLLVSERTLAEAMAAVPVALAALAKAREA